MVLLQFFRVSTRQASSSSQIGTHALETFGHRDVHFLQLEFGVVSEELRDIQSVVGAASLQNFGLIFQSEILPGVSWVNILNKTKTHTSQTNKQCHRDKCMSSERKKRQARSNSQGDRDKPGCTVSSSHCERCFQGW